ncbi:flagellar hook-length control protein FliK [Alteromonas sp. 14N.309.X.WAT.G.H12]|uniref:flagellar hook-length control protein FliK n=1 Tax=Alteromonas sp. 14N.309.X.WAT.G.H12 TaxID=3120824 RepID=UPI002FD45CC2
MPDMNLEIAKLLSGKAQVDGAPVATASSQSETLATLAKAVVQRLPDHILQITLPRQNIPPLQVQMPPQSISPIQGMSHTGIAKDTQGRATLFDHLPITQQAVITQADTQRLIRTLAEQIGKQTLHMVSPSNPIKLYAQIEANEGSNISLKMQLPGSPKVNLSLNNTLLAMAKVGEKVQLALVPAAPATRDNSKTDGWQLTFTPTGSKPGMTQSLSATSPLIKLAIAKALSAQGIQIETSSPKTLQTALKMPPTTGPALVNLHISLRLSQLVVSGVETQPKFALPLKPDSLAQLPNMPNALQNIVKQTKMPLAMVIDGDAPSGQARAKASVGKTDATPALSDETTSKGKLATDNINKGSSAEVTAKQSAVNLPLFQEKVTQLSRQLLAETGSTHTALTKLINTLNEVSASGSAPSKVLAQQWRDQLGMMDDSVRLQTEKKVLAGNTGSNVTGSTVEPASVSTQIQQLLSTQALVTQPVSILSAPNQSGFINALIAMLQVNLAGKALRSQPDLAKVMDQAESIIAKVVNTGQTPSRPSRVVNEFAHIDSRSNMLNQVKTLLANHQQQKIQNAESRAVGQDTLYYVLPVSRDGQPAPEILFRTEEKPESQQKDTSQKQKIWHLTMKLNVGELGELLAKTRITGNDIHLQLYASTDTLLTQVYDTLPFLLRRFSQLGLNIEQHSCQRGRLQGSLKEAPYQLFEALV